jgi:hypothetical protein
MLPTRRPDGTTLQATKSLRSVPFEKKPCNKQEVPRIKTTNRAIIRYPISKTSRRNDWQVEKYNNQVSKVPLERLVRQKIRKIQSNTKINCSWCFVCSAGY